MEFIRGVHPPIRPSAHPQLAFPVPPLACAAAQDRRVAGGGGEHPLNLVRQCRRRARTNHLLIMQ